ncbi:MAG TPA: YfhO family protein [Thermoanaerobaculia bacterium]|nr:YfhO family protein [Thermoanaerobaculia bacterium]
MTPFPAIVLYLATAIAIVLVWRKFVQPIGLAASIALILLPLCFTGRALLTGRVYAPIDLPFMSEPIRDYGPDYGVTSVHNGTLSDLYAQMMPWQHAVRAAIGRGDWPVWNPYLLCGSILAANMQAAPYDILSLLGLLLAHAQALTFAASMAFFLAGFFAFAFARAIGCGEHASLIAAAGYMFNAALAFAVGWPIGRAWTFLPLVLFAVRRVVHEPGLRSTALLTIAFVLTIFAGHPETLLHIVAIGAAYGVMELWSCRGSLAALGMTRAILHAVAAGVIALLVTAISLLPFLSVVPETAEYDFRHNVFAERPLYWSKEIVTLRAARTFLPFFGGQPERDNHTPLWEPPVARVGTIIVALALAALLLARRKETWFFFGLAVVALFAAFDAPPIALLLHELPLFDISLNHRLGFGAAFALSILAAIAVNERSARLIWTAAAEPPLSTAAAEPPRVKAAARAAAVHKRRKPVATIAIAFLAVGIAFALATRAVWAGQISIGVDRELMVALTIAELAPLAIAALLLAFRTPARVALPALLGLLLLQRTLTDGAMYPALPVSAFYPDVPVVSAMKKDTSGPFRMVGAYFAFVPDTAALYDLEDVRGYEAMTFERLMQTFPLWCQPQSVSFNLVTDLTKPFLSFLNVKYALTHRLHEVPAGWRLVMQDRDSRLIENTRVLPRAFIPRRVRYEQSGTDALLAMSKNADFGDVAWITVPHYPPHEIANGPGTLTLQRNGAEYTIGATMERDGWIVLSDSKWPGWRAYIDGRRVETHYANHAFVGVFVPRGKHELRVVYVPEAFTRGRNITLATLAALALFLALRHRRWVARSRGRAVSR